MKKIYLIILLSSMATQVLAETCADGQGTLVVGINKQNYCLSNTTLNWWSAHAWCHSATGVQKLVGLDDICDCTGFEGCDKSVACPNVKGSSWGLAWTSAVYNGEKAYMIDLGSGKIMADGGKNRKDNRRALCYLNN